MVIQETGNRKAPVLFFLLIAFVLLFVFVMYGKRSQSVQPPKKNTEKTQPRKRLMGAIKLLDPLPDNASEETKMQKYRDYQKAAREAPYLEIKDCKPNPVLIKIVDKPNLIIKNSGDGVRQMWFDDQHYTIPAHDQISVSLDFARKAKQSRYWYVCDLNTNVVSGIIWVGMGYDR